MQINRIAHVVESDFYRYQQPCLYNWRKARGYDFGQLRESFKKVKIAIDQHLQLLVALQSFPYQNYPSSYHAIQMQ
jgi:hypothetical protein